jgi:hypothetical protein
MGISRREWILEAGVLAAAEAFAQQASPPDWFDRPMRWAQLAFVEDDPGHYDPHFWLQYFARIHADAACLSAGGCVAFYPTKIPLHYRSKFLGDGDAFGEMLTGCRKQGMHVIARVDPHAAHQDVYDAHPDWIAVDAAGQPRHHWAMPELWVTCALGPYNFDFMPQVIREIMAGYQVDGIFANRWSGSGMCYCVHCRRNFREFCGQELPRITRWTRLSASMPPGGKNGCSSCIGFGMAKSKNKIRRRRFSPTDSMRSATARRFQFCLRTGRAARETRPPGRMADSPNRPAPLSERSPSWDSSAWGWRRHTAGRTPCKAPTKSACGRWMAWRTAFAPG